MCDHGKGAWIDLRPIVMAICAHAVHELCASLASPQTRIDATDLRPDVGKAFASVLRTNYKKASSFESSARRLTSKSSSCSFVFVLPYVGTPNRVPLLMDTP